MKSRFLSRLSSRLDLTVLTVLVFILMPTVVSAAVSCCICSHPKYTKGQFCIKNSNTACETIASSGNKELANVSCKQDSSANPCKPIAQGGTCSPDIIDGELGFKLSALGISDSATAAQTTPALSPLTLNIAIPGLTLFAPYYDSNGVIVPMLAQYIAAVQKMLIGFGLVVAAIMVIYGGFLYIVSGTGAKVKAGMEIIKDALIGLVIILGAYVILANINPNTATLGALQLYAVKPERAEVEVASTAQGSLGNIPPGKCTFEMNPAGMPTLLSIYHCAADVVAKELNVDPCYIFTAMNNESYMAIPNIVGHDENVTGSLGEMSIYPERKRFVESGVTYKKLPITNPDNQINDDVLDLSKEDLGLDPRFSHGFGLMMFTFKVKPIGQTYTFDGESYTPKQILDPYWGIYFGSLHIRRTLRDNDAFDTQKLSGTISMVWIYYAGCYNKDGTPGPCSAINKSANFWVGKPARMGEPNHRNNDTYWCMKAASPYENINHVFLSVCRGDFPLDVTQCEDFVKNNIVPLKPDIDPVAACTMRCYDKRMPVVGNSKDGYKYRTP